MAKLKKLIFRFRSRKGLLKRFFRREAFWLSFSGLLLLLLGIVTAWLFWALFTWIFYDSPTTSGPAGDKFGGITALFSGLAFAGLIFTLFVQKKELQYQREELGHLVEEQRQTKGHLKEQAEHLKSQAAFIEKQVFEATFFQLLSTYSDFVSNIRFRDENGTDALEKICDFVRPASHVFGQSLNPGSVRAVENYEEKFQNYKDDLAPYFRLIYNILKFLDRSEVDEKSFYANLLRAKLNSSELSLLALNCASVHGTEKMAPLVKKFNFLKHFDDFALLDDLAYDNSLRNFYSDWKFRQVTGQP